MSASSELIDKARRAAKSARLLLEHGDIDGACNRAYYAMFDAARAVLLSVRADESEASRTHSALITAFSLHLVKTGQVPVEQGRALNRVADIRLIADYTGDQVDTLSAKWAVEQAEQFVSKMASLLDAAGTRND